MPSCIYKTLMPWKKWKRASSIISKVFSSSLFKTKIRLTLFLVMINHQRTMPQLNYHHEHAKHKHCDHIHNIWGQDWKKTYQSSHTKHDVHISDHRTTSLVGKQGQNISQKKSFYILFMWLGNKFPCLILLQGINFSLNISFPFLYMLSIIIHI